ncbi:MAG: MaoC family dehydratase [Comamonadaceae bacterium]|nr:MAG: MaoC family dehydratase [Comamonadaceae bacterium]
MADRLHWEDLAAGTVRELGTTSVTAEEIKEFAGRYDPQPFHLDEEAGRQSLFGGLCASGWQTCALAMRLTVDGMLKNSTSLGSPGLDSVKWLRPVYPGDQLALRHTILEARALRKRPDTGLVRSRWEMFNQDGVKVLEMEGYGFFGRRTPATADELAALDAQRDVRSP